MCPDLPAMPLSLGYGIPLSKAPSRRSQPAPPGNFRVCPDSALAYADDTPRQLKASENHKLLRLQGFWASLMTKLIKEPQRGKIDPFNREADLHLAAKQQKLACFLPLWQWISCTWTGMAARFYRKPCSTKPCWRYWRHTAFHGSDKSKIILYQNSNSSDISTSCITVSGYILEF